MRFVGTVMPVLLVSLFVGCDHATTAPGKLPTTIHGDASVSGHIHFVGTPPERRMIDTSTCQAGSKAQQEETIVVGKDGGLRDVIVYLKDAPASVESKWDDAVLDQIDCRYVPHVLAIQVGQPLKITTSDTAMHNVHYDAESGSDNFGLFRPGDAKVVSFDRPQFVRTKCDVHAWMNATVGVMPNPFFSVTAADGSFDIARIPPGHYTVAAWHPLLGERTAVIDVSGPGTSVDIDFAPPK